VCFALLGPGVEVVARKRFEGDRRKIQTASVRFALRLLLI
jgi:nicotinamide mononucleotide (NMN) deamidase PncC